MTQYIFVQDFIILKSEIVSVEFKEELSTSPKNTSNQATFKNHNDYWMAGTIVFILRDGSTRIVSKHCLSKAWDEVKADIVEQMKAEPKPTTSKTVTTTTIRKVPVNSW